MLHLERWRSSNYILFQLSSWKGTNTMLCLESSISLQIKAASSHPQLSRGFVPHQSQAVLWKKGYPATEIFLVLNMRVVKDMWHLNPFLTGWSWKKCRCYESQIACPFVVGCRITRLQRSTVGVDLVEHRVSWVGFGFR